MKDKLWERCAKDFLQLKPHWEETFRESFPISATSTLMLKLIVSSRKHFSLRLRVIVFDTAFPLKKKLLYLYGPFPLSIACSEEMHSYWVVFQYLFFLSAFEFRGWVLRAGICAEFANFCWSEKVLCKLFAKSLVSHFLFILVLLFSKYCRC